jgi:hypothetical protein
MMAQYNGHLACLAEEKAQLIHKSANRPPHISAPLAGVAASGGLLLTPAMGAVLMSLSTVIVAINARLLGKDGVTVAKE